MLTFVNFNWLIYFIIIVLVLYITIKLFSKVIREEQEELQYMWMIIYMSIPLIIFTVIGYSILANYAFLRIPLSGDDYEIYVIEFLGETPKSIVYYLLTVFGTMIANFIVFRFILSRYYQLPQTINNITFLCALTTAPWIFLFLH